jgi:aminopeptidase
MTHQIHRAVALSTRLTRPTTFLQVRGLNCSGESAELTGLVIGLWSEDTDIHGAIYTYTKSADAYDKLTQGKLTDYIKLSGPVPQKGEARIFYGLDPNFSAVALVGLGDECVSFNENEQVDEWKEAIRCAAAVGCKALQDIHIRTIFLESFGHAETAAEGGAMGLWMYQELKNSSKQKAVPRLELHDSCDFTGWQIGLQKAAAQNLSRQLSETPSNVLTPIGFAQASVEVLAKAGINVEIKARTWIKLMEMHAFLAAARGSCEPPIFLELSYFGCEPDIAPVVLIGKGVTFDSGGLCLKPCSDMRGMRGDMSGAACVVAACRAVAALQLPINLKGIIPLCENLPGTCGLKPGDIVRAKNGKTILVHDTDFDGRLSLADGLSYSSVHNPKFILDVGTLCRETRSCLGAGATAAFCNNEELYEQLKIASIHTGDRVWRMPLWNHFTEKITQNSAADVMERYRSTGASCSCAAFLREFIPNTDWVHMDTFGTNMTDGVTWPYLRKGMTGRPTRTMIEFLAQLACQGDSGEGK